MCSEDGSDVSVSSGSSDSANESSVEANDAATELYSGKEGEEANQELVAGAEKSENAELVEGEKQNTKETAKPDSTNEEAAEQPSVEGEKSPEEIRAEINEKSNYSDEVNEHISSVEELEVYQKANLREENVDGRVCLVRDKIDMDYVDPKSGMTNRELMEKGRAPYDAKTGERIELHHIGQDYDSPLAELTADSEHGNCYSSLHTKDGESWRNDSQKSNHYNNVERPEHWKSRAKGG
ncbi:MAG: nuclease [Clostridia bacterium]|nr:nuclease [Clostridia bacterium]